VQTKPLWAFFSFSTDPNHLSCRDFLLKNMRCLRPQLHAEQGVHKLALKAEEEAMLGSREGSGRESSSAEVDSQEGIHSAFFSVRESFRNEGPFLRQD